MKRMNYSTEGEGEEEEEEEGAQEIFTCPLSSVGPLTVMVQGLLYKILAFKVTGISITVMYA